MFNKILKPIKRIKRARNIHVWNIHVWNIREKIDIGH